MTDHDVNHEGDVAGGEVDNPVADIPVSTDEVGLAEDAPLTLSMMARWFGVPLVIIGTIVGGAVCVVLLFGAPASPQQRSINDLLLVLESTSGARSLGVLLPREKELWQAALELTKRIDPTQNEISTEELNEVTGRLVAMVRADVADMDTLPSIGAERVDQRAIRSKRFEFLIHALGRTRSVEAIEPLVEIVRSRQAPYVDIAMQQLGDLHHLADTAKAVGPILDVLASSPNNVTKLTACTVLSILADQTDQRVIDALKELRLIGEGEVSWSAGLALARLGSHAGKSTLLDLLDRSFWESSKRYRVTDEQGAVHQYEMPPGLVVEWLCAAIEASSNLSDTQVWELIKQLESDSSPVVRAKAIEAAKERAAIDENVAVTATN